MSSKAVSEGVNRNILLNSGPNLGINENLLHSPDRDRLVRRLAGEKP
ncbi:hypothetical protein Ga0451573_004023, partial [Peptococcaceae bacterium DYL19]|nr:hypothetical protein [Phosphitispora fastidiosa]